jgi:hypothetical protein
VNGLAVCGTVALGFMQRRQNQLTLRDEFFAAGDALFIVGATGGFAFLLPVGKLGLDGAQRGRDSHDGKSVPEPAAAL